MPRNINNPRSPPFRTSEEEALSSTYDTVQGNNHAEQRTKKQYHPQYGVIRVDAPLVPRKVSTNKLKKCASQTAIMKLCKWMHHLRLYVLSSTYSVFDTMQNDVYAKSLDGKNLFFDINGAHSHQSPSPGISPVTEISLPPDIIINQTGCWTRFASFCVGSSTYGDPTDFWIDVSRRRP